MLWFSSPPYLRWVGAGVLLIVAFFVETRAPTTERYPYAAVDLVAGETVTPDRIRFRDIPAGVLPPPGTGEVVAVGVDAGHPLTETVLSSRPTIPDDWWVVALDVRLGVVAGDRLAVVLPDGVVPALVIEGPAGDSFSLDHVPAMVAVPSDRAVAVAAASQIDALVVALVP